MVTIEEIVETDKREPEGVAVTMPGMNNTIESMQGTVDFFRNEGFNVLRASLTENPAEMQSMTPESACAGMTQVRDLAHELSQQTPGQKCVLAAHSASNLFNAIVTQKENATPFHSAVELAPSYHLTPFWHSLAEKLGRRSLPKFLQSIPILSWNPHMFSKDPLEKTRVHKSIPVSAYHAVFRLYVQLREQGLDAFTNRLIIVDQDDELIDANGTEEFLNNQKPGPIRKFFKMARKRKRGMRYHHNITDDRHIGNTWWPKVIEEVRGFLHNKENPDVSTT